MASSPANSLRKSFGNIIAKVSNRPSFSNPDEVKQVKLNTQPCFACGEKGKKNIQCRPCSKIACTLHSSVTSIGNTERVCDDCVRGQIQQELSSSDEIKDKISSEIQETISTRGELTIVLNKQNTKVKNLQIELSKSRTKYEKEKNDLVNLLFSLQKENKSLENECDDLRGSLKNLQEGNARNLSAVEGMENEAVHMKINLDEMIKERATLLSNLNELRDFIRLQVPVRMIKKIICNKCYIAVQNAFAANFKGVAPVKVEQQESAKLPQKKGACASCVVF